MHNYQILTAADCCRNHNTWFYKCSKKSSKHPHWSKSDSVLFCVKLVKKNWSFSENIDQIKKWLAQQWREIEQVQLLTKGLREHHPIVLFLDIFTSYPNILDFSSFSLFKILNTLYPYWCIDQQEEA